MTHGTKPAAPTATPWRGRCARPWAASSPDGWGSKASSGRSSSRRRGPAIRACCRYAPPPTLRLFGVEPRCRGQVRANLPDLAADRVQAGLVSLRQPGRLLRIHGAEHDRSAARFDLQQIAHREGELLKHGLGNGDLVIRPDSGGGHLGSPPALGYGAPPSRTALTVVRRWSTIRSCRARAPLPPSVLITPQLLITPQPCRSWPGCQGRVASAVARTEVLAARPDPGTWAAEPQPSTRPLTSAHPLTTRRGESRT